MGEAAGLQIEHRCPQCSAPVTLDETDRLLTCDYCRVSSYMVAPGGFRYVLPQRSTGRESFYFPYWRMRGALFTCGESGLEHRVIDTSLPGLEAPFFPRSLGVRAQAMKLRFASPEIEGGFLRHELSAAAAAAKIAERTNPEPYQRPHLMEFIGETLSVIYSPFHTNGRLIDGVSDKPISSDLPEDFISGLPVTESVHWKVDFVPTICPHCGWDMEGERDSLVLTCRNCKSLWKSAGHELAPLEFGCLPGDTNTAVFLPFWRLSPRVGGAQLKTFADLVRLTCLPKVIQKSWEERPLYFWVPAFKIRPGVFIRLACALTLAQPPREAAPGLPYAPTHPVNLPIAEAAAAMKVIVASLMKAPRRTYPRLEGLKVDAGEALLVYVPLHARGMELTHPQYRLTVNRAALRYGRQL